MAVRVLGSLHRLVRFAGPVHAVVYLCATTSYDQAYMEWIEPDNRWPGRLIALIALLLIAAVLHSPQRTVTAPPQALSGAQAPVPLHGRFQVQAAPTAISAAPQPDFVGGRTPVVAVGQLTIYTTSGSYSDEQARDLAVPLDEALHYVSSRTGLQLSAPVAIIFDRRATCGADGAAYTRQRVIMLYACPDLPMRRGVNIVAHELVHQLAHDHYGAAHLRADLIMSEGFATWGAGKYWLGREPDFRSFVQHNYADALLPLDSDYRSLGTIDAMNRLYYQWASLVDYLVATHGRDAFDKVYASGQGIAPNTADYSRVLGADLHQLEQRWQQWLMQEE